MITKMTKYSFILLKGDREKFLEELNGLGVVDISRSSRPVDAHSHELLSELGRIRAGIASVRNVMDGRLAALIQERDALEKLRKEVLPWGDYDMDALKTFGPHYYRVPEKKFNPGWADEFAIQEAGVTGGMLYFVILGSNTGFPLKELPAPLYTVSGIDSMLADKNREIEAYTASLKARQSELPGMEVQERAICSELNLYLAGVTAESAAEDSLLVYEGFAPSEEKDRLAEAFDAMDIYCEAREASASDCPPIKLKNNGFIRQFEPITGLYGMPVYDEFDPTVFLSFFFLLFFAMCMGDAGYGLLLIAIGFALRGRSGSLARMWSLIVTLGAGTVAVGLVMGGFFGINLYDMSWVPGWMKKLMIYGDIEVGGGTYAKQMVLSMGIGILHICLAMTMKAVYAVRNHGLKDSLGTLGWTLLIVGGVVTLAVGMTSLISETAMKWILISVAGVSALGIYFFNKWGRNPLINFGAGLWDTYNTASGLMGDVLSYIRLYALGLSGAMLGSTFNLIADMVKGSHPTWQWIPFAIIVVLGHTLNLAMCCLGAFVHPLRLNFVEFFKNSGYEGSGTAYNPLRK